MKNNNMNKNEKTCARKMKWFNIAAGALVVVFFVGGIVLGRRLFPDSGYGICLMLGILAGKLVLLLSDVFDWKFGYYRCRECGHTYTPTWKSLRNAGLEDNYKVMQCPHCNEKATHKKVYCHWDNI